MRLDADDLAFEFIIEPGHDRKHNNKRHHTDRDPAHRYQRNKGDESRLPSPGQMPVGDKKFEFH
jgi:hypothetical protein